MIFKWILIFNFEEQNAKKTKRFTDKSYCTVILIIANETGNPAVPKNSNWVPLKIHFKPLNVKYYSLEAPLFSLPGFNIFKYGS